MKNILYLHTHDMGRYNSLYGYAIDTPNIQAFSNDAVVFQNAFCCGPTCSPSRAALLTGLTPHASGMIGLAHRGFSLNNPQQHLSSYLRTQGYHTVLCGAQHEAKTPDLLGYDEIKQLRAPAIEADQAAAQYAAEYFAQAKSPFFISVGLFYPHRVYLPYTDIDPSDVRVPACLPDNPQTRGDFADYMTSVKEADKNFGIVLDALKASGLYDDTIVVLTTDHGIAFPDMKCHLYDAGIGITLAIKDAGQNSARRADTLVSHIDVFPTLCDLTNLPPPEWLEGVSLKPVLKGSDNEVNEYIYSEVTYHAAYEPMRCIRSKQFKFIRHYDNEFMRTVMPNVDDGPSKRFLMEYGLAERKKAQFEMYDLYYDPNERNNLADDPAYAQQRKTLETALYAHMERTGDPYFFAPDARVPLPAGAIANRRECTHPDENDFE